MIQRLHVQNFALIDDVTVTFGRGLNVITGETGAGKSIILGALSMILGERARIEAVRTGSDMTIVEGIFTCGSESPPLGLCRAAGIETDGECFTLRREMGVDGRSKAFVNGRPITLSLLKKMGDLLVDLHGQHQHQSLLNVDSHVDFLDTFGALHSLRNHIAELYDSYQDTLRQVKEFKAQEALLRQQEELYRFQLKEIREVNPLEGEEEDLERERNLLENSEKLCHSADEIFDRLHQAEDSIVDRLHLLRNTFETMSRIDTRLTDHMKSFDDALQELQELSDFLLTYRQKTEYDPDRLEEVRDRLGAFSRLKRKYGGSLEQVVQHRRFLEQSLAQVDGYGDRLAAHESELARKKEELGRRCVTLSQKRKLAAQRLKKLVESELKDLGMRAIRFEIGISWLEDEHGIVELDRDRYSADHRGMDHVEFFIAPNVGEELKPLAKIASGGEISRIMLAIKSTLAKLEGVPTMVFDEIDIGIGGKIAEAVGKKLKKLAGTHQIICITHLPQIASLSEEHYVVAKRVHKGRTVSAISQLGEREKVGEIARLLGGKDVTPIVRKHAEELVARAGRR
ncbi:MAG: DNA repair protein RecN [Gemmatimonadota bacterium]|nr:MAG: DNA repair protein RecN [Gemmatimonadota bacterium]